MRYAVTVKLKDPELDAVQEGFAGIDKIDIPKDSPWNRAARQILAPGGVPLAAEICGLGIGILRELRVKFSGELDRLTDVKNIAYLQGVGVEIAKPSTIAEVATEVRDRRFKAIDRAIKILERAKENLDALNPILHQLDFVQGSLDPEDY